MLSLVLFASAAFAHSGVKQITIDGTVYPPFDSRIDPYLGQVKRIEWSHDRPVTAFNPITEVNDPGLTCRVNPRAPLLKAVARAGAEVKFDWTGIVRMHQGPIITWMGLLPTPDTKAQDVKFFKIWELGFDTKSDRWGNQVAADAGNTYSVRIPSDIAPGTYVLRTELIALHGNMENLKNGPLKGVQFYPHCFNVEVQSDGKVQPEGVTIPGAYKLSDAGLSFSPFMTYGNDTSKGKEVNSKYTTPGPAKYAGAYDAPTGEAPKVLTTGYYPPELESKYKALLAKVEVPGNKLLQFVNTAWPAYQPDKDEFKKYGAMVVKASQEEKQFLGEIESLRKELEQKGL